MAFWGVEIKPGNPFTHTFDSYKGRLHIAMATLGHGTAITKSTLQCNVGKKSPVYICSLYPGKTESLQLNLELEEAGNVILSVIGPRSIHLCGYYLARGHYTNTIADSTMERESYGEDIADTETEKSDQCDEDDYDHDDSFIDDDSDLEVRPSSPIFDEEEASFDSGRKSTKGSQRRLRKKYQLVVSDDDSCLEEKKIVNDNMHVQSQEIDYEDSLPNSFVFKKRASGRVLDQKMVDNVDKEAFDASNHDNEDCENSIIETKLKTDNVVIDSQIHREVDPGDIKRSKKKKKGKEKETKSSCNGHSIELGKAVQDEPKMNIQDGLAGNEQHQQADDKKTETADKISTSSQVGQVHGEKPKRKRKEQSKEETLFTVDGVCISNLVNPPQGNEHNKLDTLNEDVKISENVAFPSTEMDSQKKTKRRKKEHVNKVSHPEGDNGNGEGMIKANKETPESNSVIHKFSESKVQHQKLTIENVDNGAQDYPEGNQSEDKKVKKKKKRKSQGNEIVNSDVPVSAELSIEMMKDDGNNMEDTKSSQVRTLSNGLVIQELETGKENGTVAALGKKISINYTGKLKENEVVVDSNVGQAPFKFRLGKGEVIESWDIGLEGMRVGEKRRLVIPPSMTSKNDADNANIPPNSWLIYDFELVKVH